MKASRRTSAQDVHYREVDLLEIERLANVFLGSILIVWGLFRRSRLGMLLLFGGAYMIFRGLTGEGFIYQWPRSDPRWHPESRKQEPRFAQKPPPDVVEGDVVTEASWESFPASDPPAW